MPRSITAILAASLAVLVLCLAPGFLLAAEYHVNPNHPQADDTGPGSENAPWRTIQQALENLQPGETALIHEGVYHEAIFSVRDGAPSAFITLRAPPGEHPVIDGQGVDANNGIIISHAYLRLIGLAVRNFNENGIWMEGAHHVELQDLEVYEVAYGIGVSCGSHDFSLVRCLMHHFDLYGFDASPGDGKSCSNGLLVDCLAHTCRDPGQNVDGFALGHGGQRGFTLLNCAAYGVFDGFDISAAETTLAGCRAWDCGNSGFKVWQDQVVLLNCTARDCSSACLELDWDEAPGTVTVANCTFHHAGSFLVWVENGSDTLVMRNCLLSGGLNIGLAFEQQNIGRYQGDHNIIHMASPGLRAVSVGYEQEFSAGNGPGAWPAFSGQDRHSLFLAGQMELYSGSPPDLRPAPGSPAVDTGDCAAAPKEDIQGRLRPQGPGCDIGAYEL